MQIESISLFFYGISGWFVIVLAAAASAAAVWYYRNSSPAPTLWTGRFLTSLRALVFILIILAFAMPVLRMIVTETSTPKTAVLLDTSMSMDIPGDEARGRDALDAFATMRNTLGGNGEYFSFDSGLENIGAAAGEFSGAATDISSAVSEITGRDDIGALVLISDGRWNLGENPSALSLDKRIPVYAVAVGSYDLPGDISVLSVSAPSVVYSGDDAEVTVALVSNSAVNRTVPVDIVENGTVIATASAAFDNTGRTYCTFSFPLMETGLHSFEARIHPEDDAISGNNSSFFDIQALKSRFGVLVFSAGPSPDTGFLRRVLDTDDAFSCDVIVGGMLNGDSVNPPDPLGYDLIAVIDGGGVAFNAAMAEKTIASVGSGAGLFCLGSGFDGSGMAALERILPVRTSDARLPETSFQIVPTEKGSTHFLTTGVADGAAVWNDLPPLNAVANTVAANGAAVLAEAKSTAGSERGVPAIIAGRYNAGNIVVMPFSGLWRWKLMMAGTGKSYSFYDSFVTGTLRWLASEDGLSPLKISTGKSVYFSGENIEFEARLYDSVFMPVSGASVTVVVDSTQSRKTILEESVSSVYRGTLPSPGPGEHSYTATAWSGTEMLAESSGVFSVAAASLERLNAFPDHETLALLCSRSGGISVSPGGIDSLTAYLDFAAAHERMNVDKRPWFHPLYLLLIITLLSAEWTIRKRQGML